MASDALTSETFFEHVRKSGLLDEARLTSFRGTFPQGLPFEPRELADAFIRAGLLSKFQTEAILRGKWKGLVIGGKYRLVEMLGAGGMGAVYLCEHVRMRRLVALKMLPDEQMGMPGALERFEREARAAAALQHPHIVQAYDLDQDGNKHFLVMEYIEGMNLQQFVERNGRLAPVRAAHYVAQAALGLQHANNAGLVHRDIKPSNLLIDRTGTVKILDMGLARFFRDSSDNITAQYDEKSVLGTADFIAPEQALHSSDVDIRADIYSLGATFYFLLTAKKPFGEGTVTQKLLWHQLREVPSPRESNPAVTKELAGVVMRMMAKQPDERYQTPHAVADALAPWTRIELAAPTEAELPSKVRFSQATGGAPTTIPTATTAASSGIDIGAPPSGPAIAPRRTFVPTPPTADTMVATTDRTPAPAQATRPKPPPLPIAPAVYAEPSAEPSSRRWMRALIAVSVIGVLLVGLIGWWLLSGKAPPPSAPSKGLLIVSKVNVPGHYSSILEALQKAPAGSVVRVEADEWEEAVTLKDEFKLAENLTLEGYGHGGEPTRWFPGRGHTGATPLLSIINVPHLTVRNFIFDGDNRLRTLVNWSLKCHGFVGDQLTFRGYVGAALKFSSCDGEARPLRFTRLAAQASKNDSAVVQIEGAADQESRQIIITDSRFDGLASAVAVRVMGECKNIKFERNRFYQFRAGLWYPATDTPFAARFDFVNNTFYQVHTPLHFEQPPSKAMFNYGPWLVTNNLFIDANRLVAPANLNAEYLAKAAMNATNKEGLDGASLLKAEVMDASSVERTPTQPRFLLYPPSSPLHTANDRKPVGVPPPNEK
jgi:serine/threonine protein kinase